MPEVRNPKKKQMSSQYVSARLDNPTMRNLINLFISNAKIALLLVIQS